MKWWHKWRMRVSAIRLAMLDKRIDLLERSEYLYQSSYYTDRLHDAVCKRIQIASCFEWHKEKAK